MDDWNLFWAATTAAATVATAISTGAVLWLQRRNRPEPRWEIREREQAGEKSAGGKPQAPYMRLVVENAGDGTAYGVEITGVNCAARVVDPRSHQAQLVPRAIFAPGETIIVRAFCPRNKVRDAAIRVLWIPAPTRLNRPIVDVLPILEGVTMAHTGEPVEAWRYRELPWWNLLERWEQWRAQGARRKIRREITAARKAEKAWMEIPDPVPEQTSAE